MVLGVAVSAVLLAVAGAPRPAAADEFCDARVFDESGGRIGSMRQGIDQAATTLSTTLGAEIYVRAMSTVPGADLDAWQAAAERRCPVWSESSSGARSARLIVLAVSVDDRRTGIYYGSRWKVALDPVWRSIQDAMNTRFREGDIGGGLIHGLSEVAAAIAPSVADVATPDGERRIAVPVRGPDGGGGEGPGSGLGVLPLALLALGAVATAFGIARKLSGRSDALGATPWPPGHAHRTDAGGNGFTGGGGTFDGGGGSGGGSDGGGGGSSGW